MVGPIDLRSSHVFAQWLRLIAGAYMHAINRHARLLHFLVSVNDHMWCRGISSIFNTVFRYLPIFLTVLRYWVTPPPPKALLHCDYFNSLTLSNVGELSGS